MTKLGELVVSGMLTPAEGKLIANLEEGRRRCRRKRWIAYAGGGLLFLAGLAVSYFDGTQIMGLSDLRIPLGPMLLSVALARAIWGRRAAWVGTVPMVAIAAASFASLLICRPSTGRSR
jgi:peptidoglycan/LPS O-acetylase OafA/YrhL